MPIGYKTKMITTKIFKEYTDLKKKIDKYKQEDILRELNKMDFDKRLSFLLSLFGLNTFKEMFLNLDLDEQKKYLYEELQKEV